MILLRILENLVRRGRVSDEVDAELQAHLELLVHEKMARGVPPAQARREAALELGGARAVRDRVLDARAGSWVMHALRDLSYGGRMMRRYPLFAVTAMLSLAIGISANTAVFAMADAFLFKPPAGIPDPRRLVDIGRTGARGRGGGVTGFSQLSYPNYRDLEERVTSVTSLYAYQPVAEALTVRIDGSVERALTTFVSDNYFSALGVQPAIGRLLSTGDTGRPDALTSLVISHRYWLRRFHGATDIVGRTVEIGGHSFTIGGVAPAGFHGTTVLSADLWISAAAVALARPGTSPLENRAAPWMFVGGRLAPDRTMAVAAAELDAVAQSLASDYAADNAGLGLRILPSTPVPGNLLPVGPFIMLLSLIVLAVLGIACANVAGVLLARAATRQREIAVRLAIGASRGRILRQLLTETLILVGVGGIFAIALARLMTLALVAWLPALPIPVDLNPTLDLRVLGFTFVVSIITVVLTGIAPAWQASRTPLATVLRDEGRGSSSSRTRLRHAFVVGQVALSLLLIVIAGLFMRGLARGAAVDLGFDSHGVDLIDLDLAGTPAFDQSQLQALMQRIRSIPGVQHATLAMTGAPIGDGAGAGLITAPGVVPPDDADAFEGDWNAVDAGYFDTLAVPLTEGRAFTDGDVIGAPPVAIVGSALAARFWPGQSAIGRMITLQSGRLAGPARLRGERRTMTVVGVARDLRYFGPTDDSLHWHVYVPLFQQPSAKVTVAVRPAPGRAVIADVRAAVAAAYPQLPPVSVHTLDDTVSIALVPQRIAFAISATLGAVGLLLAAIGVYGVTSYGVTRRTREFGIRLSLGATPSAIVTAVVGHGLLIAGAGAAIGLAGAAALARLLQRFLFGTSALDPVTIAATTALLTAVTLSACLVPAFRATRIDIVDALRTD